MYIVSNHIYFEQSLWENNRLYMVYINRLLQFFLLLLYISNTYNIYIFFLLHIFITCFTRNIHKVFTHKDMYCNSYIRSQLYFEIILENIVPKDRSRLSDTFHISQKTYIYILIHMYFKNKYKIRMCKSTSKCFTPIFLCIFFTLHLCYTIYFQISIPFLFFANVIR